MIKAIFLDLDETLCDTAGANKKALTILAGKTHELLPQINQQLFADRYLSGIYRQLDTRYQRILSSIADEGAFRIALIQLILSDMGCIDPSKSLASDLQKSFDEARTTYLNFFPGIQEMLLKLRSQCCLIVITNGPAFSQRLKIKTLQLERYVDHIIIGGLEKAQKPASSIFQKALTLANCSASESIHIGDSLETDIAGANSCAIQSIWINHGQALANSLDVIPTHSIQSPSELPTLLYSLIALNRPNRHAH